MFAKAHKTSGSSLLKNKDAKKLRKDLSIRFRDAFSEEKLQLAMPTKCSLKKVSFQAPSRMVVFADEDSKEPLAFDVSGKGELCFAIYALWRAVELLPRLVVHAPVSEFVLRGADVMLPGVVFSSMEEVQALRKGELRAVYARGNPHAFAIGEMLVDADEIAKTGKKGKAMQVWHYYGDELWKMGPQTKPNDGFPSMADGSTDKKAISPLSQSGQVVDESDEEEEEEEDESPRADEEEVTVDLADVTIDDSEEKAAVPAEESEDAEETVTKEEMDAFYYQTLLQALRSGAIKEKQLPMLASTFHATVLLPCRPAGVTLNIKHSTHKKLSTFLKAMASKGLLQVKDKSGVQSITAIGVRHPDVVAHNRYRTAEEEKKEEELAALAEGGARAPPPGTYAPDVQELLGLSQALKNLFASVDAANAAAFADVASANAKKHWMMSEVRDWITKYIEVTDLVDPRDRKYVRLNGPLTDAVFGKKAPPGGYPERMARPDLLTILLNKCQSYHRVCLYPGHAPRVQAGQLKKIEIHAERAKQHANSIVTTLAYYHQFGIDGPTFAKDVQKKWGSSATTQMTDNKARGEEIRIQGQMVNEVQQYLTTKYKIATNKYCSVTYGKGVKAKKN
ncbi:hypothetical protein Poli38472_004006 [Pythium oligandrum]|uniref:SUI1 domain-containing protein n=1 Tax=Pythium oligandrum TaxID=41045 RepID=A0A8K1FKN2_PYTOL|nr:hypothetical protein Poli38472_004006 [Pythium oligandrum]|eukprot:TMW66241.1 hypothetical protein Poli38472_004006 [Pythium oligandrum]